MIAKKIQVYVDMIVLRCIKLDNLLCAIPQQIQRIDSTAYFTFD
jgi:hypothetical protein